MRGEHIFPSLTLIFPRGSSPHARGALGPGIKALTEARIIPACAGSPATPYLTPAERPDHPRMRGEHTGR